MKFNDLLMAAIRRSEIPLRFEPGAEESVAKPVIELLHAWLETHEPSDLTSDFQNGQRALLAQLVAELKGETDVLSE
ncbi:MAG: hypothetical protein U0Q18_34275 [Bryobacteraceae bacterium]